MKPRYVLTPRHEIVPLEPEYEGTHNHITKPPFTNPRNPIIKTDGPYWTNPNNPYQPGKVLPASEFQNDDVSRTKDKQPVECSGTFFTVCTCATRHQFMCPLLQYLPSLRVQHVINLCVLYCSIKQV